MMKKKRLINKAPNNPKIITYTGDLTTEPWGVSKWNRAIDATVHSIIIHQSGGGGNYTKGRPRPPNLNKLLKVLRGKSLATHYCIKTNGEIWQTASIDKRAIHTATKGYNDHSIGIDLINGYAWNPDKIYKAFIHKDPMKWVKILLQMYGVESIYQLHRTPSSMGRGTFQYTTKTGATATGRYWDHGTQIVANHCQLESLWCLINWIYKGGPDFQKRIKKVATKDRPYFKKEPKVGIKAVPNLFPNVVTKRPRSTKKPPTGTKGPWFFFGNHGITRHTQAQGIIPHQTAQASHGDGATAAAYCYFRHIGKSPNTAYSLTLCAAWQHSEPMRGDKRMIPVEMSKEQMKALYKTPPEYVRMLLSNYKKGKKFSKGQIDTAVFGASVVYAGHGAPYTSFGSF